MDNIVFNDVTDNTAQSNLQHRSIPESKESFKDCNKNASTELIDCQDYKILQTNADIYINESITRLQIRQSEIEGVNESLLSSLRNPRRQ